MYSFSKPRGWSVLNSMAKGVNHAACGTDGTLLYSFGGRGGPNTPSVGYDIVQIYDPSSGKWTTSSNTNYIPALPQQRGGMGAAVYLGGEFYVIGGETTDGSAGSKGAYNRVDVYNPSSRSWRSETNIPNGMHGIFPIALNGKIHIAGGGTNVGKSSSSSYFISSPVSDFVLSTPSSVSSSAKSCASRSCVYAKNKNCQCDAACVNFGNCCSDYADVCTPTPPPPPPPPPSSTTPPPPPPPPPSPPDAPAPAPAPPASASSCRVRGCNFSKNYNCQCDAKCSAYGNCCSDYNNYC